MPYNSPVDPGNIGPGWWNLVMVAVLLVSLVALLVSLVRHLKRVDQRRDVFASTDRPDSDRPDIAERSDAERPDVDDEAQG